MNENARQGVWNGALPPIGYHIVAAEQRGSKTKKKLEIDPAARRTLESIAPIPLLRELNDWVVEVNEKAAAEMEIPLCG